MKIFIYDTISKLQTHAEKVIIYQILQLMTRLYILECPVFLELQKYRYQNEINTMMISYYNIKNNIHYESVAPKTTNQSVHLQFLMFTAAHPQKNTKFFGDKISFQCNMQYFNLFVRDVKLL